MKPETLKELQQRVEALKKILQGEGSDVCNHQKISMAVLEENGTLRQPLAPCFCGKPRVVAALSIMGAPETGEGWERLLSNLPGIAVVESTKLFGGIDFDLI